MADDKLSRSSNKEAMFYQLIQRKRDQWYQSSDCTVRYLVGYIRRRGMMRR